MSKKPATPAATVLTSTPTTSVIEPHVKSAIASLHAALARASAQPVADLDSAIDIILEAQDELLLAIDKLVVEIEADEAFVKAVKKDKKRKAA